MARIGKEGLTERAIILYKLNKSLLESSTSVGIHKQKSFYSFVFNKPVGPKKCAPSLSRYKRQASKFFLVQRLHPRLFIKLTKKNFQGEKGLMKHSTFKTDYVPKYAQK